MNIRQVQQALIDKGYDVGDAGADGVLGRDTTAAIRKFQLDKGIPVKWPGTLGPMTLKALARDTPTIAVLPWMSVAKQRLGLNEKHDNRKLQEFLKADGHFLGDPARFPWCGDFVETCILLGLPHESVPTNPYLARNWARWGLEVKPTYGAVLVFWRTSKARSSDGHVGFYVREEPKHYVVLGGNQSNGVTEARLDKARLLTARWPKTFDMVNINVAGSGYVPISTNEA